MTIHSIGGYSVPDRVLSAVQEASQRTGVDFGYMMAKAATESGFNPQIQAATSNATGLYQFIDSTWLEMVRQHGHEYGLDRYAQAIQAGPGGRPTVADQAMRREILDLRNDPRLSALMAGEYAVANREHLSRTVGGEIGPTEMYLGHFLGAHGASRFLNALRSDPQQTGAALFPAAAAANRPAFYDDNGRALTLREIYGLFDRLVSRGTAMAGDAPAGSGSGPRLVLAPPPTGDSGLPAAAPTADPPGADALPLRAMPGGSGFFAAASRPPSFFTGGPTTPPGFFAAASPFDTASSPQTAGERFSHPGSAAGPAGAGGPTPGERQLSLWAVLTASRPAEDGAAVA
jgi:hypothetical protein